MKTTIDFPDDDLFRRAQARSAIEGRTLQEMLAEGLRLVLQREPEVARVEEQSKRGSAGAWAKRYAGVAELSPNGSSSEVRMDYYRQKYSL